MKNFSQGQKLAQKYNFNSSAQVALAWLAQRSPIPIPFVTKSDNAEYLEEDLNIFSPAQVVVVDFMSLFLLLIYLYAAYRGCRQDSS